MILTNDFNFSGEIIFKNPNFPPRRHLDSTLEKNYNVSNMKSVNLTKTIKNFTSGWISISKDNKKVLASAKSLNNLLSKLKKMGNPEGYLMRAAKDYSGYVGS